jgi:phenylacetic acid degradation operon negative regulatory protein
MAVVGTTTVPIPTRVLVLGMAHEDGTIRAEELYPVAEACGQTPEQVRSCLRRLVSDGLFTRTGSGRHAVYSATDQGAAEMGGHRQRTRLAYAQDAAGRGWDRRWRLAAFAVPEARRSARDGLRDRLLALGGAAIQGGLYVSPHPWEDDVRAEAKRLGLDQHLTLASTDELEVGGVRDPRQLAATLWPLAEVAGRYERFIADHQKVIEDLEGLRSRRERLPDATFLPLALAAGAAYDDCSSRDPYLPPELLPRPWPGRRARELVVRSWRLALTLRSEAGRPALFGAWDTVLRDVSLQP